MQERRHQRESTAYTIPILGDSNIVFQVMSDLIEGKNNPDSKEKEGEKKLADNTFEFISDGPSDREARTQAYSIVVFDPSNPSSIELMQHYLQELSRYNKAAKHIFILSVNYDNKAENIEDQVKAFISHYKINIHYSYLVYTPRDPENIANLRKAINATVFSEANQWYEWAHHYYAAYSHDPSNKSLARKALSCFAAAYKDDPKLVGHQFFVLFSELTSPSEKEFISDISTDDNYIEKAIIAFKKQFPAYKEDLISVPLEQKGLIKNEGDLQKILLKQAVKKLTSYAHPNLFKQAIIRKRHVKDIDTIIGEVKENKINNIYALIERLNQVPNQKRSFVRLIDKIRVISGDEPTSVPTKKQGK